jgi:hypothetical protein
MKLFGILVVFCVSQMAVANVMNVALDCKSASGKTVISADLPGDDTDASITLTYEGNKTSLINADAKKLLDAGNEALNGRTVGGDIHPADVTVSETSEGYTVTGSSQGAVLFLLASSGPLNLVTDRDYGYRKGEFKAKMKSLNPQNANKPLVADLNCKYDYAP